MVHVLSKNRPYAGYDICGHHRWEDILPCSVLFICVPTPQGKDGHLDCSIVESTLERLEGSRYEGIVVVKSTLRVGFTDSAVKSHPTLKIVYNPEFLRENNLFSWGEKPDRFVIAGKDGEVNEILRLINPENNVPVLRMNYLEAEMGKLAHNAFIAVKVSFTNAVELTAKSCGANPSKVMSVIWADRRVKDKAHLVPGLGGYDGKCIPKDSSELNMFMKEHIPALHLMDSVKAVNDMISPSRSGIECNVYVIIPTSQQDNQIAVAMESVCKQSFKPKKVVVVYDQSKGLSANLSELVGRYSSMIDIALVENKRVQNLSGAINSGLDYLKSNGVGKLDFIALLDDDDEWECRYLQNCATFSSDIDCNWVISGIIRIDLNYPKLNYQSIPEKISKDDFLAGNPNVQGSNMFVRFDMIDAAGGMDEDLVSTTDRDLCIRLLGVDGIKVGFLRNHLVYHDCITREDRLSRPCSEKKTEGLCRFYCKYKDMMTPEIERKFIERAKNLFGVSEHTLKRS